MLPTLTTDLWHLMATLIDSTLIFEPECEDMQSALTLGYAEKDDDGFMLVVTEAGRKVQAADRSARCELIVAQYAADPREGLYELGFDALIESVEEDGVPPLKVDVDWHYRQVGDAAEQPGYDAAKRLLALWHEQTPEFPAPPAAESHCLTCTAPLRKNEEADGHCAACIEPALRREAAKHAAEKCETCGAPLPEHMTAQGHCMGCVQHSIDEALAQEEGAAKHAAAVANAEKCAAALGIRPEEMPDTIHAAQGVWTRNIEYMTGCVFYTSPAYPALHVWATPDWISAGELALAVEVCDEDQKGFEDVAYIDADVEVILTDYIAAAVLAEWRRDKQPAQAG